MRAFVVGNGPSLADTNLDLIKGEMSYACNNIHFIYTQTDWRPTHYVRIEALPVRAPNNLWYDSVKTHLEMDIYCYLSGFFFEQAPDLLGIRTNKHHVMSPCGHRDFQAEAEVPVEWHLPQICHYGGSVPVAMQLALSEGVDEIVLLGCDMYPTEGPKYFDIRYDEGLEEYQVAPETANDRLWWAHQIGINYHRRRRIEYNVVNATLGGKLELYPRKELEEIQND